VAVGRIKAIDRLLIVNKHYIDDQWNQTGSQHQK